MQIKDDFYEQDQKPDKLYQNISDTIQTKSEIFNNENNVQYQIKKLRAQIVKQKFYDFFKDVVPDPFNYTPSVPSDQQLEKHKIKCFDQNYSFNQPYIRVKNTQQQGSIVVYTVIIAVYELEITLMNIDQYAKVSVNKIGSGLFERVRIQSQNNRMFVVKRRIFKNKKYHLKEFNMMANKQEIHQAIIQLSIYKICSLLKIGPAAETDIGFDLICYKDCIEFQIQYCMKIENKQEFLYKSNYEKQIKQCLLILHFQRVFHKDIKPDNILFSSKYKKHVFTDFGISHPAVEKIEHRSQTDYKQKTSQFTSQQMLQIRQRKIGYINRYGNDVNSFSKSLRKQIISQNIKSFKQKQQQRQQQQLYEYEYLKLKYYCIKLGSKIKEVQYYWRFMDKKRIQQLISIVNKSKECEKIKSVYNYLSKLQKFKKYYLDSFIILSQSMESVKIDTDITEYTQLQLKNALRIYGYSKQLKMLIMKRKSYEKYKNILNMIDENEQKDSQYIKYTSELKQQIQQCQLKKDYQGVFKKWLIILSYGDIEQQLNAIDKLQVLNYERTKDEEIEQIIRLFHTRKNIGLLFCRQNNPDAAKAYNTIAIKYVIQGNYQIALKYLLKSVDIYIRISEEQNRFVIIETYRHIANLSDCMRNYETALIYHKKIIDLQIKLYGQQHPNIASAYNNIAGVYTRMGKHEIALTYFTKSLSIYILFHGQQHKNVAQIYNNIASVYHFMSQYETELIYYTNSLKIEVSLLGQQHPNIGRTYFNIALTYCDLHNLAQSFRYCFKSLKIQYNLSVQQYQQLAYNYKLLSNIFLQKKIYSKSLHYAEISLYTFIRINPLNHPQSLSYISLLAIIYQKMKKIIQAYFLNQVQYQLLLKNVPNNHRNLKLAKQTMNKMEKSMPSLFHHYTSNIQFMNDIDSKYNQQSKHKLFKLLLAKKLELKFEKQYKTVRMDIDYLKSMVEIYLCYKYLGYQIQMKKTREQIQEEVLRLEQSQQKAMFRDFIGERFS